MRSLLLTLHLGVFAGADIASIYEDEGKTIVQFNDGTSREVTNDEVRAAKVTMITDEIKSDRDRRKGLGCPVGPHRFHSDDASRIQQLGLVMMGAAMPAGIKWKTMGGGFADMTPLLAQQIFAAQAARDMALFAVCEQHIAAAALADDPLAYDYSAGWPD